MPKVSVIIPTYNCAKYLPETINSVIEQTYQNFEIVLIDDGSTDNTKEIVGHYTKSHNNKIKYIYQQNRGLACARNTGIKKSQGEYIALLDADDKWLPERLSEGIRIMGSDRKIGLVHANIIIISEAGKVIKIPERKTRYLSGMIFKHIFLRKAHIACPTVLIKQECIDRVGMFDENLTRLGCEDRELWLRISQFYKIEYIKKELACYRDRNSSMSKNTKKMIEARYYVINKFTPPGKLSILRNQSLCRVHRDLGDDALLKEDFKLAKQHYLKAVRFWFFSFWAIVNLLKSILRGAKNEE